ncbi:MAG TPA: glyceraldehyde 3-phosphate dehydrogenase NAD-binding domain-containing protein [Candidatus Saccharimonadales bacterium]|nr:glyceraldehyde 3-phosphate dehydrogenase NAD-binding domain-containing protein [Candidatus Saccharimonadales bacterium]
MATRIGLMGFGRLGRNIFRILSARDDVEIAAISDVAEHKALEYLLRFDTVLGRFPDEVSIKDGMLRLRGRSIPVLAGRDPGDVQWRDYGADIVVEATARPRSREQVQRHLDAGAKRVVLCVPPLDPPDITVVMGVNEDDLGPSHRIISNASCTANCLAPIAKLLHEKAGIRHGFVSTIHAYTNAQRLADVPAGSMRTSRAAAENIIPADTRAHELVMDLIPELKGRLGGLAMNVPVPDGSVIDFVAALGRKTTKEEINGMIREAAAKKLKGIVQYETSPIVSSDVIGNPHSAIFDSQGTQMLGDDMVKILAWFDNGWGYSHRVLDVVKRLAAQAEAEVVR